MVQSARLEWVSSTGSFRAVVALALLLAVTPSQQLDSRLYRGEWEQVLGELRKQQAETSKAPDRRGEVRASVFLARAQVTSNAYHLRDEQLADEVSSQALKLAEQQGDPLLLAEALQARGRLLYWRAFQNKQWGAAQGLFERARDLYAQHKDLRGEADAWFYLGLIEQQQNRLDAGDERFQKGLTLARSVKDPVLESFFHRHLAASAEERGRLDEAEKGFVESARLRIDGKACVLSPFAQLTLAEFYEKAHRSLDKVPKLRLEAATVAARCGSNRAALQAHLDLAKAAKTPSEKKAHATQAVSFAKRFGDEALVKEAQALLGT
jgi:tetratricopeptide (TPR) repeat protein